MMESSFEVLLNDLEDYNKEKYNQEKWNQYESEQLQLAKPIVDLLISQHGYERLYFIQKQINTELNNHYGNLHDTLY